MSAKSKKTKKERTWSPVDYNCEFDSNIKFLEHLINCLQGKKDPRVIKLTIEQLEGLIIKEKERVKKKEENGKL